MQRCNKVRFKSLFSIYLISNSSPLKSISEFSGAASSMSDMVMEGEGGVVGVGTYLRLGTH